MRRNDESPQFDNVRPFCDNVAMENFRQDGETLDISRDSNDYGRDIDI